MESQAEIQTMTFRQFFKIRMESWMAKRDEKWRAKWLQSTRGRAFDASINAGIALENTHKQFADILKLQGDLIRQKCFSDMHSNHLAAVHQRLQRLERILNNMGVALAEMDHPDEFDEGGPISNKSTLSCSGGEGCIWTGSYTCPDCGHRGHKVSPVKGAFESDEEIDAVIYRGPGDR